MSYLSLLEQFLQQESQSSLEKKKILELYIRLARGSSEETKARYAQMNCGNRPPITSLGLQSAGRGLWGGLWEEWLGLPCARHIWSQPAQTNPLQHRLSPPAVYGTPLGKQT